MNILFYGAGVIGSYLIHILIKEGHNVNVVLTEERKASVAEHGIEIYHKYQHLTSIDKPQIADGDAAGLKYDAVFAALPFNKMADILKDLASVDAPVVILIGNNPVAAEMETYIKKYSPVPKEVLFGFQVTAGKREDGKIICARLGNGYMDIGCTDKYPDEKIKKTVSGMFGKSGYKLCWRSDMKEYLICHPASILPLAFTVYACGGEFKNSTKAQRKLLFEASKEGYDLLKRSAIMIRPENDDKFYNNGLRGMCMKFLYYIMTKKDIGELAISAHCRSAVEEMERLDAFYNKMKERRPDIIMNSWDELKSQMPSWDELKETYGKKILL